MAFQLVCADFIANVCEFRSEFTKYCSSNNKREFHQRGNSVKCQSPNENDDLLQKKRNAHLFLFMAFNLVCDNAVVLA